MDDIWETPRFITFLGVLALHLALIALLVMASRPRSISASTDHPIELMFFAPTKVPKVRATSARPQHLSADIGISLAPPGLNSPSPSAPASVPGSDGAGVNWAAEAQRAVRAFEIRRDNPPNNATLGSSPWDAWRPQRKHRGGDQLRTASGDWIVWINAECYQVARWHSGAPALEATEPPTVCPDEVSAR